MTRCMWFALALAGCPGDGTGDSSTSTPDACRDDAACGTTGLVCVGPQTGDLGCGIPPMEECTNTGDCGGTEVCHAIVDSCSGDGFGSVCAGPCSDDVDCGLGLTCRGGACEVVPCSDDPSVCPAWMACEGGTGATTSVLAQNDGCAFITCTDDGPCASGACVGGVCQSGPGTCGTPPLPPP